MEDLDSQPRPHKIPRPFDLDQAALQLSELRAQLEQKEETAFLELTREKLVEDMLHCLFGNSPFLGRCLLRDLDFAQRLFQEAPTAQKLGALRDDLFNQFKQDARVPLGTDRLMQLVRILRQRTALLCAVADVGEEWTVLEVTATLSNLADMATDFTVAHLLRARLAAGELSWPGGPDGSSDVITPDLAEGSGYFVLGMGKLGAHELNYSSDIDLIVFYDADAATYHGKRDLQDSFIKLTRDLVRILQERTQDGYVFRTDLRLRPDAGATPVAISVDAAEIYYQSTGLNWERAAMIKARVVAGDRAAGADFLDRISPFVWRKHLDFAALDDVHAMKMRIHSHHGHGQPQARGQDVKLGHGGIREIEFFAQAQQLISGGREPQLRIPQTLGALEVLARIGAIEEKDEADLKEAYLFLRRLEHRLQMVNDEQTHMVPEDDIGFAHIATFMGYEKTEDFESDLLGHLGAVQLRYESLFSGAHSLPEEERPSNLSQVFSSEEVSPAVLDELEAIGYRDVAQIEDMVRNWGSGRYRACRSERARQLLGVLTPEILRTFGATANPDAALARFDEFLGKLPSGVQLFSLFQANPKLLSLLADIMGSAPALAEFIGRNTLLLDAVISPDFFALPPDREVYETELGTALEAARDFQDVLDIARRWANDRKFQIGVQTLQNTLDVADAYIAQTNLADAILRQLLPAVIREFAAQHGEIADGELAVIGMGSLGGAEMSFSSDLDLVFLYQVPDLDQKSEGPRPLPASQYYSRLAQRFINALTALTGEGRLYEVDMRLRPSGGAGPIAVGIESFEKYHQEQSWTWEHMALTRARVVVGPSALVEHTETAIAGVLRRPRDHEGLLADVSTMRQRMAQEFATDNPWEVKHVRGGLLDIEFLCQYWQLLWAHEHHGILSQQTAQSFRKLGEAGLIDEAAAADLVAASTLMGAVRGFLRQCFGSDFNPREHGSDGVRMALAKAAGLSTFEELERQILRTQEQVRSYYEKVIEEPARKLIDQEKKQ